MKSLTEIVSESFIWGVGITRPRKGQERHAAWFITGTLGVTFLALLGLFFFVVGRF